MKKSYYKIVFFELFVLLCIFLNSFVSSILGEYIYIFLLFVFLIIFKILFGFEKDRHRRTKDIIFELIIFIISFYLLYYLFGIYIGFAKTINYYSMYGMFNFVIPLVLRIVLFELFRYYLLCKVDNNKLLIIVSVIFFIIVDSLLLIPYKSFDSMYDIFMFCALTLLPSISVNVLCSYLVLMSGYKPSIVFRLCYSLVYYLLPIIPNPSPYLKSILDFCVPLYMFYKIYVFINRYEYKEISRDYRKKRLSMIFVPVIISLAIVYSVSGYFRFYAICIASGSMNPAIKKGDVVIVDKSYDDLSIGDVIAFYHNDVIVVHRLVKIVKDKNDNYYYTKGDANTECDNFKISSGEIVGVVRVKIDKIGYPTVWINGL